MIKAVIFDFYETLVEIDKDTPNFWEILSQLGFNGSPHLDEIWNSNAFDGMITPKGDDYLKWRFENLSNIAKFSGVPKDAIPNVVNIMLDFDRTWTVRPKKCAGLILEFLLSQKIPVAICTNWDYDISQYIKQASLPPVDAIITSANIGARKPNPLIFEYTCRELGVQASDEVFFVGDSWRADIMGALHAGLQPVWLTQSKDSHLAPYIIVQQDLCACLDYFRVLIHK